MTNPLFKSPQNHRKSVLVIGRPASGRSTYVRDQITALGLVPLIISFGSANVWASVLGILAEDIADANTFREAILKPLRKSGSLAAFSNEIGLKDSEGKPIIANCIVVDGLELLSTMELDRLAASNEHGVTQQIWGKMSGNVQAYLTELRVAAPEGFYAIIASTDSEDGNEKLAVNPDLAKRLLSIGQQVYTKAWTSKSGKVGGYTVQTNASLAVTFTPEPLGEVPPAKPKSK